MKTKFGWRLKKFFHNHAGEAVVIGSGVIIFKHEQKKEQEALAKATKEFQEEFERMQKEYNERVEQLKNDPANQLSSGGWIWYDGLYEPDAMYLSAEDVPLSSLGDFGKDVIDRGNQHWADEGFRESMGFDDYGDLDCHIEICVNIPEEVKKNEKEEEAE